MHTPSGARFVARPGLMVRVRLNRTFIVQYIYIFFYACIHLLTLLGVNSINIYRTINAHTFWSDICSATGSPPVSEPQSRPSISAELSRVEIHSSTALWPMEDCAANRKV